jgi:hypothetical protein
VKWFGEELEGDHKGGGVNTILSNHPMTKRAAATTICPTLTLSRIPSSLSVQLSSSESASLILPSVSPTQPDSLELDDHVEENDPSAREWEAAPRPLMYSGKEVMDGVGVMTIG